MSDISAAPLASKIAAPAACPAGDTVAALQSSFGNRPVIDFKTVDWQEVTAGGMQVFAPALVRGRLVDLEANRVLWEESCAISSELDATDLDALRRSLERSAATCAEHFAERFSGVDSSS